MQPEGEFETKQSATEYSAEPATGLGRRQCKHIQLGAMSTSKKKKALASR
jgi:hypothetical protein